jgi:hypothetical protein
MPEKIIFLETTLARLLEWIHAADAKIPPILAISTSMLAIVAALLPKASDWNSFGNYQFGYYHFANKYY